MEKTERIFRAEEVVVIIGISLKTLNIWYQFKRENPDNEYAKILPEPQRRGNKGTRYWTQEDIKRLIEFQDKRPTGRNGVMGDITHSYWGGAKRRRKKRNAKRG